QQDGVSQAGHHRGAVRGARQGEEGGGGRRSGSGGLTGGGPRGPRITVDKIVIKGGGRLRGEVQVSGAKNAALPILASSLLASGRSIYRNVPDLGDVRTMRRLLGELGARVTIEPNGSTIVDTSSVDKVEAP